MSPPTVGCGCRGPALRSYDHKAHSRNVAAGLPPRPPRDWVRIPESSARYCRARDLPVAYYHHAVGDPGGPSRRSTLDVGGSWYAEPTRSPGVRWVALPEVARHVAAVADIPVAVVGKVEPGRRIVTPWVAVPPWVEAAVGEDGAGAWPLATVHPGEVCVAMSDLPRLVLAIERHRAWRARTARARRVAARLISAPKPTPCGPECREAFAREKVVA